MKILINSIALSFMSLLVLSACKISAPNPAYDSPGYYAPYPYPSPYSSYGHFSHYRDSGSRVSIVPRNYDRGGRYEYSGSRVVPYGGTGVAPQQPVMTPGYNAGVGYQAN